MRTKQKYEVIFSLCWLLVSVGCAAQKNTFEEYYIYSGGNKNIKIDNNVMRQMKRKGFNRIQMLYDDQIDSDNNGRFEKNNVLKNVSRMFPQKEADGILALDWEGTISKILRKDNIDSEFFKNAIEEKVELLNVIHKFRPNIKIGYYGLPFRSRNVTGLNKSFIERQYAFAPIFKNSDIIFPSIYVMRKGISAQSISESYQYAKANTEFALKLASQFHNEVIPFIWHRYYPTIREKGLTLIPVDKMKAVIRGIRNAEFEKRVVAGVVWWRSDNLFYNNKRNVLLQDAKKENGINRLIYLNTRKYSKAIKEALNDE